jgi:hypothetical protein
LTVLWGDQLIARVGLRRETDITEELIQVLGEGLEPLISEDADVAGYSSEPETKNGSVVLEGTGMTGEKSRKRRRARRVAAVATAVILLGSGIALFAASNSIPVSPELQPSELRTGSPEADRSKDSAAGDADGTTGEDDVRDLGGDDVGAEVTSDSHDGTKAQDVAGGISGGSDTDTTGGSSGNTGGGSGGSPGSSGRVWHEGWNEWVVDVPGHYEQRMVSGAWDQPTGHYGSVCRTCGADISGFAAEHLLQTGHMGGYYTDWIPTGTIHHDAEYENVWVPEQGHNIWHEGYWD